MDEIHVKPDISYKGGKLLVPIYVLMILRKLFSLSWSRVFRKNGPALSVYCHVQIISTDNYPLNVKLFKLFSPVGDLEIKVPHPCDNSRVLFLTFDFVHILKSIRNNWLNLKSDAKSFIFPNFEAIRSDSCSFPLRLCSAFFKISVLSIILRRLVLKVIHESTIAALTIQNEQRCASYKNNTSEFVEILLSLWNFLNINVPFKHVRLNDPLSRPFSFND